MKELLPEGKGLVQIAEEGNHLPVFCGGQECIASREGLG